LSKASITKKNRRANEEEKFWKKDPGERRDSRLNGVRRYCAEGRGHFSRNVNRGEEQSPGRNRLLVKKTGMRKWGLGGGAGKKGRAWKKTGLYISFK